MSVAQKPNVSLSSLCCLKKETLHRVKRPAYSWLPSLCRTVLLSFWVITLTPNSSTAGYRQVTGENWQLEKTFQLREYKGGHCERSEPTNRAAGMRRNRLWPHNKATQGISAIKGWGLYFFRGSRSDVLLPPNMKTSASCALSPHGWNRDESRAGSDGINPPDFINKLDRCRQSVSRCAIKGLQKDTVLSSHPDTPIHLRVD